MKDKDTVTMKDVARRAGVSAATVSRVLNNDRYILDATRDRVKAALEELGYNMNYSARGLRTHKTFSIGLVTSNLVSDYNMHIAQGVDDAMTKAGYTVIICGSGKDVEEEKVRIGMLMRKGVDGIIIMPATNVGAHYRTITDRGVPLVLVDRLADDFQTDAVLAENVEGCASAVDYLLESGFLRIGFVAGDLRMTSSRERLEGYRLAHRRKGVPVDESLIRCGENSRESAFECMRELYDMAEPAPCVMAANYKLFVGVSRFLARRGKDGRMPYLASFDDMADLIHIQSNCVVSVSQPMQEIGARAADLLLRRMRGDEAGHPEVVRLPTELRILCET